ncbi:MAG: cellulase family glycosylhydrolase [Cytophagaceae bacterium]
MKFLPCSILFILVLFLTTQSQSQSLYGVNLAGAEFGETVLPGTYGTHYIYPSPASLDYYKGKGLKLVRLPFLWERLQPKMDSALSSTELARIDAFVAGAQSRGIYVILDVHNYARRTVSGTQYIISTPQVPVSSFVDFWTRLATHFKNDTTIWAYGIMNEPNSMNGTWPATAQSVLTGVRSVDTVHTILMPGTDWSKAESWQAVNDGLKNLNDPYNNLLYEAHQYFDADYSGVYNNSYDTDGTYPTIGVDLASPFVNWLIANNKKGFFGEYGVPGDDPRWNVVLDNFLSYLHNNCVGGTYWAGGPWWGNYNLSIEPSGGVDKPQMSVVSNYTSCSSPITATKSGANFAELETYPNPLKKDLTVHASLKENAELQIVIFDVLGQAVFEFTETSVQGDYTKVLDLSNLENGCYFIKIVSGNNFQVRNLIKN